MRFDLYARKSTRDEGRSVGRQERTWRADCTAEGSAPGRVFVDPDLSASRYARKDRPDYAALLAHVAAGESEGIWLWEGTRGSRQMGEWVALLDLCREHRVLLRVYGGGGDDAVTFRPWVQRDREALIRMGMGAEGEVERSRARTMAGNADAAAAGRPAGPLLDGYRREYGAPSDDSRTLGGAKRRDIRQVIDEPRAQLYRTAAESVLAGVPLNFIARSLNARGVPTASGRGEWTGHGLGRALLNPGLQGHRVLGGKIAKRDAWPAILDADTGARLHALLTTPGRRSYAGAAPLRYLLSGALHCGACRRPMKGDNWRGKLRYECARSGCSRVTGPMDRIDEVVSSIVVARLARPDAAPAFEPNRDDTAEITRARNEVAALAGRLAELHAEAARPAGPSIALVAAAERELLPQIEAAESRLSAMQTPPALRGYDRADLAAQWDTGRYSVGEKRVVVMALAEVVLSPVGKGGRWSLGRLGESRWHGDRETWAQLWAAS